MFTVQTKARFLLIFVLKLFATSTVDLEKFCVFIKTILNRFVFEPEMSETSPNILYESVSYGLKQGFNECDFKACPSDFRLFLSLAP